jgi:hypothetical protein
MNHAKFCPAAQDRSTPESLKLGVLLRRRLHVEQEQDHGRAVWRNGIALEVKAQRD